MTNFLNYITSKTYLFLALFSLLLCLILFYPKKYITVDEHNYIGNAYHIVDNSLRQECDRKNLPGQFEVRDYCIYKYNLGASIILVPFLLISENFIFIASFLSFVISIFIFYKILKLLDIDKRLIILFALYPSFLYISRTALSEGFSMMFILLSTYIILLLEQRKADSKWQIAHSNLMHHILLGAGIGMAVLIRYTNILPLGILLIGYLFNSSQNKSESVISKLKIITYYLTPIIIGALPFALLFFYININLYGGLFRSGYYFSKEEVFGISYFVKHIVPYLLVLISIYPLMLLISLLNKKYLKFNLAFLSVLFLYASSKNTLFEGEFLDAVKGIRFLVPVLPLLMISYFEFIDQKILKKFRFSNLVLVIVFILLIINLFALSFIHNRFINKTETNWPDLRETVLKN